MKKQIETAIRNYIESNHRLGDRSGGSGHMSHVSYQLHEFKYQPEDEGNIKVQFRYTLFTETEFTYYPDNPPYEEKYEKEVLFDEELNVVNPG